MPRQDTRLESEGAEFLVLGQLLIHRIAAYKTYTNLPGYDLVAINPDRNTSARIQVKSRWATGAPGFLIKNFDCDFVVSVCLNRGRKDGKHEIKPPEFHVLPVGVARSAFRKKGWGRVVFRDIPRFDTYRDHWGLIESFLARRTVRSKSAAGVGTRKQ